MTTPPPDVVVHCPCGDAGVVETSGPPRYRDLRGEPRGWTTVTLSSIPLCSRVLCPRCTAAVRRVVEGAAP